MKENDKRLECSAEKKLALREARLKTKSRRASQVVKTFECKIKTSKLNTKQKNELEKLFVEAKWFYNYVLNVKNENECNLCDINSTDIKSVIHLDKDRKEIESELELLSSQQKQKIIQRMISNEKTIKKLVWKRHQKHGRLKFKSEVNCIPLKQYKNSYVFKSFHKVRISGISGKLFVNGTQQFLDFANVEIANANLVRKANGYFLYVTTFWNKKDLKQIKRNGQDLGIDFGCQTNLTLSNGKKIDIQIEESERLKKFQKKASRQKKRSNNYMKSFTIVRREHQKIKNKKQDLANKFIHDMKSYQHVIIQDEQIANWQKTGHGKKVQHSCMWTIKAKLKQLDNVIVLDKWIPTTKWCPCCGKKNDMPTCQRIYRCECGYVEDRDIHSAKNMVTIWSLASQTNIVPVGCREVKLVDFKSTAGVGAKDTEQQDLKDEARRCSVFS